MKNSFPNYNNAMHILSKGISFSMLSLPVIFLSYLFIIFVFVPEIQAQTPGVSGVNVMIHRISTEQGLSNPDVYAITQDKKGFIWIGTAYGLNRFDGENFTVFENNPTDTTSLSDSFIWSLYVDKMDSLGWNPEWLNN
jgi:hypothetical protein